MAPIKSNCENREKPLREKKAKKKKIQAGNRNKREKASNNDIM